jgi:FkbM family methyltransferase
VSSTDDWAGPESRLFSLLSQEGFAPCTIFDIGASNGAWSAVIHNIFPQARFHLFEPLPFFPSYEKLLQWNMQNHPGFTLHTVALGAENKRAVMRILADGYGSSTLDFEHPEYQQRQIAEQRKLDDFVAQFSLPLPDLIKLDVQGSELAILSQAQGCLNHAELVFAETWFVRDYGGRTPYITEIVELLGEYDYDLAELGHRFYDANHRLYACDAFFLKRSLRKRISPRLPQEEPWCA